MRTRNVGIAVIAFALWLGTVAGVGSPEPAAAAPPHNTLPVGSQLVVGMGHHLLTSTSGEFSLEVTAGGLFLGQFVRFSNGDGATGGSVWTVRPTASSVSLAMQADGDLVLYSTHHRALWSTRTAGTGSHNRLVVLNDGNLAMYTSTNKLVWTSGSRTAYLVAGHVLRSGASLVDRTREINVPLLASRLTMQRDGDLVLFYGSHLVWHTNTHVPRSYLSLQSTGTLVVYTPGGHALWSRMSREGIQTWLHVGPCGMASLWSQRTLKQYWSTPYARFPYC